MKNVTFKLIPPPPLVFNIINDNIAKPAISLWVFFSLHFQTYFIIKLLNGEVFLKICSIKPLKLFIHPSLPTTRALSLTGPDCVYWSLLHPWLASWICFRPLGCCWWFNFERKCNYRQLKWSQVYQSILFFILKHVGPHYMYMH